MLAVFLVRAAVIGLAGAAPGLAVGVWLAAGGDATELGGRLAGVDWRWAGGAAALAPVLSALASWLPALLASRQDPAVALRET